MQLSHDQKRAIHDDGYVHLRGVVPRVMIDAARKAIHHDLGANGMHPDDLPTMRARSYCPGLTDKPVITDLVNATPAFALAESAIGEDRLRRPGGGQIALRFPSMQDPPKQPGAHLDGMHSPLNGVPKGTIGHFTMLVAVLLSDLPEPNCGNFVVYPGTHRLFEHYFREHGPESLLDGMPKVKMPEPRQVLGQAGDVILTHYQVAHTVGPHVGPDIRYAVFFRLSHVDHRNDEHGVMTDIWREWDGMRDVVAEAQRGEWAAAAPAGY